MNAQISTDAIVSGTVSVLQSIGGEIQADAIFGDVEIGPAGFTKFLPDYSGDYEVTPANHEQVLSTKGRSMNEDLVVNSIPYFQTSNQSGGYTVIIGG